MMQILVVVANMLYCLELGIPVLGGGDGGCYWQLTHNYLMGQITDLTELKYIWLVILTGNHAAIISCLVKYSDD